MTQGARTAEELDALLEDAFVLRDPEALASLFEPRALLVAGSGPGQVRGNEEIALLAPVPCSGNFTYVASPGASYGRTTSRSSSLPTARTRCAAALAAPGATRSRFWQGPRLRAARLSGPRDDHRLDGEPIRLTGHYEDQKGGEPCT